jgi:hypothetical protein
MTIIGNHRVVPLVFMIGIRSECKDEFTAAAEQKAPFNCNFLLLPASGRPF